MTTRTISKIEPSTNEQVGAFKIKNVLPTRNLKQVDPFLLLHHLQPTVVRAGDDLRIPPHPHAGFEVMTYLLDGEFFHRDSAGHDQVARGGDVNWMSSGSGITHSEGPTSNFQTEGGLVQLLQVWINIPAGNKKLSPAFHYYASELFPFYQEENMKLKVILGNFKGLASPIATQTAMHFFHLQLKKGKQVVLPVSASETAVN